MPESKVLAMIHGLIGSLEYFDPAARIAGADVRTIDLLGYGSRQGAAAEELTLQDQVEHVVSQIESWSASPVWLLGHSMGGAIAMMLADQRPELVRGIINVEGNFTEKDAFWSRAIVKKTSAEWAEEYGGMCDDVRSFTERCGIEPTGRNVAWMTAILEYQPASTVYAMSQAIMTKTPAPSYLEAVRRVIDRGVPIHLIAGERSAQDWDVPDFVRAAAASYVEMPGTGHVMMLEDPDDFCREVERILAMSS